MRCARQNNERFEKKNKKFDLSGLYLKHSVPGDFLIRGIGNETRFSSKFISFLCIHVYSVKRYYISV